MQRIPKIIHYCWFGEKMPERLKENVKSWQKLFPKYEIRIWTEDNFNLLDNKYCKKSYDFKKYAYTSDYVRLRVIYEFGGIYLDTDMKAMKHFGDIFEDSDMTLGFEHQKLIATGFISAVPKHPLIKQLLDIYDLFDTVEYDKIPFFINNELFTFLLCSEYGLILSNKYQELATRIKVYPMEYFSLLEATPKSVVLHLHEASWKKTTLDIIKLLTFVRRHKKLTWLPLEIHRLSYFSKHRKFNNELKKRIGIIPNKKLAKSSKKVQKRATKKINKIIIKTKKKKRNKRRAKKRTT